MGRPVIFFVSVVAAFVLAGPALAATPQQLTIPASDGAKLACSLVEPDGTPPTAGWPAVMLFHGLGGRHQDLEPLATQFLDASADDPVDSKPPEVSISVARGDEPRRRPDFDRVDGDMPLADLSSTACREILHEDGQLFRRGVFD